MYLINCEYLYNYEVPGGVKLTLNWIIELNGGNSEAAAFLPIASQRRKDFVLRTSSGQNRL